MTRNKILLIHAAAALGLILCAQAHAAIQMNARGGFGNNFRPGAWLPIIVTVENFPDAARPREKKDFQGTIEISCVASWNERWKFTRNVDVPAFSRKDFILYAVPNEPSVSVRLVDTAGNVIHEQPLSGLAQLGADQSLLTVISGRAQPLYLPDLAGLADYQRIVTISPDALPDRWFGYDSVNAVVLAGFEKNRMSEPQQKALLSWVRAGGTLIVLGGANTANYKASFIEPFLPVRIRGTKTLPIGSAESPTGREVLVTDAEPVDKAQILYESQGTLLVARGNCGTGAIVFLAPDFADDALSRHPDMLKCWAALFPFAALNNYESLLTPALGARLEMGLGGAEILPNLGTIGFVMLAYVFLVGPVNFFVLWRRKRLELAWITVPSIVAVFTIGVLITGYVTKGVESIYKELNLVRLHAGERNGVVHSAVGFFTPTKSNVTIHAASANASLSPTHMAPNSRIWGVSGIPLNYPYYSYAPGGSGAWQTRDTVALDNDACTIPGHKMEQWTMTIFDTAQPATFSGALEANVTFDGLNLQGKVVSNLPVPLHRAFISFAGYYQGCDKEPFKPGDVFAVDIACTAGKKKISPLGFLPDLPEGTALSPQQMLLKDANRTTARESLDMLFAANQWLAGMHPPHMSRAWLLGWTDEPHARLDFGVNLHGQSALTLYMIEIPVKLKPGDFIVRSQIPRHDLIDEGASGFAPGYQAAANRPITFAGDSYVTIAASLPYENADLRFDDIRVGLVSQGAVAKVSAYNLTTRQWDDVPLAGNSGIVDICPAQDYATPQNGRVFLRVAAQGTTPPPSRYSPAYTRFEISSIGISYSGTNESERE